MAMTKKRRAKIVRTNAGPIVVSPADDIIQIMLAEKCQSRRVELAEEALVLDSDCIAAYLVLAAATHSPNLASVHLANAVGAGNALWRKFMEQSDAAILWWNVGATQPYLTAVFRLGQVAVEIGEVELARKCFEGLLAMHPQDAIGARTELEKLNAHAFAL